MNVDCKPARKSTDSFGGVESEELSQKNECGEIRLDYVHLQFRTAGENLELESHFQKGTAS